MTHSSAVRYDQEIPDVLQAMAGVHGVMDAHGFDRTIHHLVQLRASQINGCAFCIKMHTREARQDGETNERLDRVIVWNQASGRGIILRTGGETSAAVSFAYDEAGRATNIYIMRNPDKLARLGE